MVANQAQVFGQVLDFYLGDGKEHLPEINRLAKLNTAKADDILLHYLLEGISKLYLSDLLYRLLTIYRNVRHIRCLPNMSSKHYHQRWISKSRVQAWRFSFRQFRMSPFVDLINNN